MTRFDLHTHHDRCGHARGKVEDYIRAAIDAGLDVIGISDHSPFFAREGDHAAPGIAMAISWFPSYIQEVLDLKQRYANRIEVLLGMESDYFPEVLDAYRQAYAGVPFDYIIGSVHLSGGVSVFNKTRWNGLSLAQQIEAKEDYYRLIQGSARCGLFQVLGHIDAMKGYYPAFSALPTPIIDHTMQIISDCGVAVEVNTSGKTKWSGGWYPSDDLLERACFYGVDVTLGSDAHDPERVGDDVDAVAERLRELGFVRWVYFRQKKPVYVAL
jgi:histidinol-phosphatase (PHP family)